MKLKLFQIKDKKRLLFFHDKMSAKHYRDNVATSPSLIIHPGPDHRCYKGGKNG